VRGARKDSGLGGVGGKVHQDRHGVWVRPTGPYKEAIWRKGGEKKVQKLTGSSSGKRPERSQQRGIKPGRGGNTILSGEKGGLKGSREAVIFLFSPAAGPWGRASTKETQNANVIGKEENNNKGLGLQEEIKEGRSCFPREAKETSCGESKTPT